MSFTIAKGQSNKEYFASEGVSNSQLGILATKSEAHLRAYLDGARNEETPSQLIGHAFHSRVLTPTLYERDYCRRPQRGYAKTHAIADKEAYEHWVRRHPGKQQVPYDDYETIEEMAKAVLSKKKVHNLLKDIPEHWREVSLYWQDDSGVVCKGRLDAYSEELDCIVDLKTTKSAHPTAFGRSILSYGYYRQAAYYMRGARACGLQPKHFIFIAIEKEPPYATGIYRITDASLKFAEQEINSLLARYQRAVSTNKWPDYGTEILDIEIPMGLNIEEQTNE